MRRPQKPFSVEVKRGRKGAASGAPTFISKPEPHVVPTAEKRQATPPPEPAKPQRRILEAIEPERAAAPAAAEAPVTRASLFAESVKPRRGRPPKVALVPAPVAERPKVAARNEPSAVYSYVRREVFAVVEPVVHAGATPHKAKHAAALVGQTEHVGHVTHAARVEAATSLPRGERWKRRLPKVLW